MSTTTSSISYAQFGEGNPCLGCPAPCCRMQLIPYKTPTTFMDLDHVRYMLLFPNTEMVVTMTGDWSVLKWQNCREFESDTCRCKVHHTPGQPRICFTFNAYNCWYKRNFVTEEPPELYRLDLARFNAWVEKILFDETGRIVYAPCFEESQAILREMSIEPAFARSVGVVSLEDIRMMEVSNVY